MPFLPFITFPNSAEVVLKFLQGSAPWFLTLGFHSASSVVPTDVDNLAASIDYWWSNFLSAQITTSAVLQEIVATDLSTQFGYQKILPPATVPAGTLIGTEAPVGDAMIVTFKTALRGRSYRGRNYVAGRVQGDIANENTWTTVRVLAMQNVYDNLPASIAAANWSHVVLSRYLNGNRRIVGAETFVQNYIAKGRIGTQRKRLQL